MLLLTTVVLAASTVGTATVLVTDTSGTSRTGISALVPFNTTSLQSQGWINSSGNDTSLTLGLSSIPYTLSTGNLSIGISSLAAFQQNSYSFNTGVTPRQYPFSIVTGPGGYITTPDAVNLEGSGNFSFTTSLSTSLSSNITYKANSIDWRTDNSGNMSANITDSGTFTFLQLGNAGGLGMAFPGFKVGYDFPSMSVGTFNSVSFSLSKSGLPTGTANITLELTDGTILGTFGTLNIATLTGIDTWYTFSNPVSNTSKREVIVFLTVPSGVSIGNAVGVNVGLNSTYGQGLGGFGPPYEVFSPLTFQSSFSPSYSYVAYSGVPSFTTATLTNSDHLLSLYLDLSLKDQIYGASMNNSSSNWKFLEGVSYADNITYSVNSTQQLFYRPTSIIQNNNLPNNTSSSNNGTITWGTNSFLSVNMTGIQAGSSYIPGGGHITAPQLLGLPPALSYENPVPDVTMPWYDLFLPAANSIGWTTNILYGVMMLFAASLIGVGVLIATGSSLLAAVGCAVAIAMGCSTGMLGWWTELAFVIFAMGYFAVSKQF